VERRAARAVLGPQPAAVRFDDRARDGKADAHAVGLGGDEWLEDYRCSGSRPAGAGTGSLSGPATCGSLSPGPAGLTTQARRHRPGALSDVLERGVPPARTLSSSRSSKYLKSVAAPAIIAA